MLCKNGSSHDRLCDIEVAVHSTVNGVVLYRGVHTTVSGVVLYLVYIQPSMVLCYIWCTHNRQWCCVISGVHTTVSGVVLYRDVHTTFSGVVLYLVYIQPSVVLCYIWCTYNRQWCCVI